jgi:hypothetical protein
MCQPMPGQKSEFSAFAGARQTGRTLGGNSCADLKRESRVFALGKKSFSLSETRTRSFATKLSNSISKEIAVNKLLKSILKTAVYIIDQADGVTSDVRDRVESVSDRLADVADRGKEVIYGESHAWRNVGVFAVGLGVGIAAGILFAPASGEEIRSTMREKVEDIGERVLDRFTPSTRTRATGTEGGI